MAKIKLCVPPKPWVRAEEGDGGDTAVQRWLWLRGQVAVLALQRLCGKAPTRTLRLTWYLGFTGLP